VTSGSMLAAVIDTETTGLYSQDRIVEIGIVLMELTTGEVVEEFETLINPKRDIGPTRIHGITASMVADAPRFDEVAADIASLIDGHFLAAHNLPFDQRMLANEFSRLGVPFDPGRGICTLSRSGMRLDLACEDYGIELINAHTALADARAASLLLRALLIAEANMYGELDLVAVPASVSVPAAFRSMRTAGLRRLDAAAHAPSEPLQRTHHVELTSDNPRVLPYLDLLGMALSDLVLSDDEMAELRSEAERLGLGPSEMAGAHAQAINSLSGALGESPGSADGQFLGAIAERLDVGTASTAEPRGSAVAGAVCFTGDISVNGQFLTHEDLEEMARAAGWHVASGVTKKKCSLLVADDVGSQSGKAHKARQFGIDIVNGDQFVALLNSTTWAPPSINDDGTSLVGFMPAKRISLADPTGVREWATHNGFSVGVRGRLRSEVVDAWNEAHPDLPYNPIYR